MTGLAYKEFMQNRAPLLGVLILPGVIAFPAAAWVLREIGQDYRRSGGAKTVIELIRQQEYTGVWIAFLLIAFVVAGAMQGLIFRGDDRRVFANFIAASPEKVIGYLRMKYELTLVMAVLTLFSVQLGDWITEMLVTAQNAEWFGMSGAAVILSYVQIILRAFEIPFTERFGVKNGSIIKSIGMVVLAIAALAVFALFGEKIIDAFLQRETAQTGNILTLLKVLLPVISLTLFYLSYRLSCRLFMKGAMQYDA